MARLFKRRLQVSIGRPGEKGVLVENLRMSFNATFSTRREPNDATIEIYNLAPQTRQKFYGSEDEMRVVVEAGYGDLLSVAFVGDVISVRTEYKGADTVTTIKAGDGERTYQRTRLDVTFTEGTPYSSVITRVAQAMGVEAMVAAVNRKDEVLQRPLVLYGPASERLRDLAETMNAEVTITDGVLQFIRQGEADSLVAQLLTPDTGLVGSPKLWLKNRRSRRSGEDQIQGIEWTQLMNPTLRPCRKVVVRSREYQGVYVIKRVVHKGDSGFSNDFYSEVQATPLVEFDK